MKLKKAVGFALFFGPVAGLFISIAVQESGWKDTLIGVLIAMVLLTTMSFGFNLWSDN